MIKTVKCKNCQHLRSGHCEVYNFNPAPGRKRRCESFLTMPVLKKEIPILNPDRQYWQLKFNEKKSTRLFKQQIQQARERLEQKKVKIDETMLKPIIE